MDTGLLQSGHTGHLPGREHAVCVLGARVHEIQEGTGHQAVCTGGRGTEQPDTDQSYKKRLIPSIAEAKVITTWETPASTAEKEVSSLGIIPPCITPSSTYFLNKSGVMTGISLIH